MTMEYSGPKDHTVLQRRETVHLVLVKVVSTGMTKIATMQMTMVDLFQMENMILTPSPISAAAMMGTLQIPLLSLQTNPSIYIANIPMMDVSM